jgi:Leucine-rich repeat (LRR) protein
LEEIELGDSKFTSVIPTELYTLPGLLRLYLNQNHLSGSISSLIGNSTTLEQLYLDENSMTGRLCSEIGMLQQLTILELSQNHFSEHIPTEIGQLLAITDLYLFENGFSGTISSTIGLLKSLEILDVDLNLLSGDLPTELGNLPALTILEGYANRFVGPIPTELGKLITLLSLALDQNSLTGSIPTQLYRLKALTMLFLNNNLLSGSILSSMTAFPVSIDVAINDNLLTSSLPTAIYSSYTLEELVVSSNYFTGTIASVPNNTHLYVLQLNGNYFWGNLRHLFPDNAADIIQFALLIDISDNGFTGSVPSSLFSLPNLHTLAASSNCFGGELQCMELNRTDVIDYSQRGLKVLDMSGLSSGVGCRRYIISRSLLPNSGYYPHNYIKGLIPPCIWKFSNLTALYLVGNGFHGPIASQAVESMPNLVNLSLANNALTGSVPEFILRKTNFVQLDLSSNRLRGNLDGASLDLCSNESIIMLAVNRLSGPLSINRGCDWSNLSNHVLRGNMFTFATDELSHYAQAESLTYYGSYTLNVAMAVSAPILFSIIALIGLSFVRNGHPAESTRRPSRASLITNRDVTRTQGRSLWLSRLNKWKLALQLLLLPKEWISFLKLGYAFLKTVCELLTGLSVILLVICVSVKVNLSESVTYLNQYSWLGSAAYLQGVTPAVILAVILLVSCIGIGFMGYTAFVFYTDAVRIELPWASTKALSSTGGPATTGRSSAWCLLLLKMLGIFVINGAIIGGANVGYLIAVLNNNPRIQIIQISLSVFKLMWNGGFISVSLKWIGRSRNLDVSSSINPLLFRFCIKTFNFVLVPCIVTSLIDASCFLNLFQQQPAPIIFSQICDGIYVIQNGTLTCPGSLVNLQDGAFTPPFIYSYQCTSALIANYVPVLLYSYFLTGLVMPVFNVLYMLLTVNANDVGATTLTRWHKCLDQAFRTVDRLMPRILRRSLFRLTRNSGDKPIPDVSGEFKEQEYHCKKRLFPVDSILATVLLNIAILGTFGLAFPYLGACAMCSTVLELSMWLIAVGRYLSEVRSPVSPQFRIEGCGILLQAPSGTVTLWPLGSRNLGSERASSEDPPWNVSGSVDVVSTLQSAPSVRLSDLIILLCVVFLFWGAMFFDMIAGVNGTKCGLIAMFVVAVAGPGLVCACVYGLQRKSVCMKSCLVEPGKDLRESLHAANPMISQSQSFNSDFSLQL